MPHIHCTSYSVIYMQRCPQEFSKICNIGLHVLQCAPYNYEHWTNNVQINWQCLFVCQKGGLFGQHSKKVRALFLWMPFHILFTGLTEWATCQKKCLWEKWFLALALSMATVNQQTNSPSEVSSKKEEKLGESGVRKILPTKTFASWRMPPVTFHTHVIQKRGNNGILNHSIVF